VSVDRGVDLDESAVEVVEGQLSSLLEGEGLEGPGGVEQRVEDLAGDAVPEDLGEPDGAMGPGQGPDDLRAPCAAQIGDVDHRDTGGRRRHGRCLADQAPVARAGATCVNAVFTLPSPARA